MDRMMGLIKHMLKIAVLLCPTNVIIFIML